MNSVDAQYQIILEWSLIYDRVTQEFERLMHQCERTLRNLRSVMEDPVLEHYADINTVFRDWWAGRTDEVNRLDELLHDPEVIVPPTIWNVLTEIASQVPDDERVQVITNINGIYRTVCYLATCDIQLSEGCEILAEIQGRSLTPEVSFLLSELTL